MSLAVAIQMDPIESIDIDGDSTFSLALEALERGHILYHYLPKSLSLRDGSLLAKAHPLTVRRDKENYFTLEHEQVLELSKTDVVLMRQDPPFDMDYIYATYLLEQAEIGGVMVVNKPSSLRDANEKLFSLNFSDYIPKTLVSSNIEQLIAFINDNKEAIVKPLDGMGGKDIYKLKTGDENINEVLLRLTNQGQRYIMAQEFLPEIKQGDKRILLINGIPIDYALARLPAEGSFKGNLAAGAKGVGQPLTERDRYLCKKIAPMLIEKELIFVGLDVIGDYITEINVTSPTGIRELDKQFDLNISAQLLDVIEEKLALR